MKRAMIAAALILSAGTMSAETPPPAAPVYDAKADAAKAVAEAVTRAGAERKRVLVDFGANWCADCLALDARLHLPENAALLSAGFVVVRVDIGRFDKNVALAARYGVPLKKGVPALVVLDAGGRAVYAQKNGEFEAMRRLDPRAVGEFLKKWAPPRG